MRGALVPVAATMVLIGCGSPVVTPAGDRPASTTMASATAYTGPMVIEMTDEHHQDPAVRGGAASHALQCAGEIAEGGGVDDGSGIVTVEDSPQLALRRWVREVWITHLPSEGYSIAREEQGRTLLTWEMHGRILVAVIVHDEVTDGEGRTGWGVESWATCDVSEFPADLDGQTQVWVDASGARVPTSVIVSFPGPEHCGWQDLTFLSLTVGESSRQFIGGATSDLSELLMATYAERVDVPSGATDTGFRRDGRELWVTEDAAFLREPGAPTGERWPQSHREIACA